MRFFNKCVGNRAPLPNGIKDSVKVYCWGPSKSLPALHTALEVTRDGQSIYLSFCPHAIEGLDNLPPSQLGRGFPGYFQESFDQQRLYEGFRKAHEEEKDIEKFSYEIIMRRAKKLPEKTQQELKTLGDPDEKVELHSLDLDKMIKKIHFLKRLASTDLTEFKLLEEKETVAYAAKWGSWASVYSHQTDTYNCSSIVLEVLYEGGMNNLTSTIHDPLGVAGGLLGTALGIASYLNNQVLQEAVLNLVAGFFGGRGAGGFVDGWIDIQSVINLMARADKSDATKCVTKLKNGAQHLGLRVMGALLTAVVSLVKSGPIIPEWLATTPELVMSLANQAKREEDALYLPVSKPIFA